MKTTENPVTNTPKENNGTTGDKNNTTNPKLPNNDPDQTPEKETPEPPKANPGQNDPGKNEKQKIGF